MDVAVPGRRLREGVRGEFRALGAPGPAGDAGARRPTVSGHRHGEEGRVWLHAVPGEGGLFRRGQRGSVERGARPGPGRSWGESVRLSRGFSEAPAQRHLLQEAHRTAHPASLETESSQIGSRSAGLIPTGGRPAEGWPAEGCPTSSP